ncbi:MAG: GTP cyclohydrolase I [Dermatophilaceae bacterium]
MSVVKIEHEITARDSAQDGSRRLPVVHDREQVNLPAAASAVRDLLPPVGRDPSSPHLTDTPRRVAHVGYLPGERILGLSKPARVVELFARDLQVQERLTVQVVNWLQEHLAPRRVGVVIEAEHMCMSMREVQASGSRTITSAVHGLLREDARSRQELSALTAGF